PLDPSSRPALGVSALDRRPGAVDLRAERRRESVRAHLAMRPAALIVAVVMLEAAVRIAADTHTFVPQAFYNTYSFAHPPALRIKPGDRVVTKTADAAGVDWNGKTVASGPNPQTGPFYVEGAEPGDMLVVTIQKLETNRAAAYSSSLLAPYAVDPAAINARVD